MTLSPLQFVILAIALAVVALITALVWFRTPLSNFLHVLLTEDEENKVWCMARLGWALGLGAYIVLALIHVAFNHASFDYLAFGSGFAAVNVAGGGGVALKGKL